MPEIVKIIAPTAFDYSHDNGVTLLRYEPGQIYEVPDVSIEGLRRRKAIEILDRKAIDAQLVQATPENPNDPATIVTGEGPEAGSDGDDAGDDDGDDEVATAAKDKDAAAKDKEAAKASESTKPSRPAK